jgi:hypothetical protein
VPGDTGSRLKRESVRAGGGGAHQNLRRESEGGTIFHYSMILSPVEGTRSLRLRQGASLTHHGVRGSPECASLPNDRSVRLCSCWPSDNPANPPWIIQIIGSGGRRGGRKPSILHQVGGRGRRTLGQIANLKEGLRVCDVAKVWPKPFLGRLTVEGQRQHLRSPPWLIPKR